MNRIYLLDAARGLAAFSVVIFHYKLFYTYNISLEKLNLENQPMYDYLKIIYNNGWIAVQFFFLLSGFIFFKLYLKLINQKKITFYNFMILRISRLYPLHFLSLVFVIIIFYFLESKNFLNPIQADFKHFILNILLIQEWGLKSFASFNEPSWSISVEILMYIIFFIIALKQNIFVNSLLIIIISSIVFFKFKLIGYGGYCFFIGGLSYLIINKINLNIKNKVLIMLIIILVSSIILFLNNFNPVINKIILLSITFPSLINFLYLFNKIFSNFGKKLRILGDISYSIYLMHYPVIFMYVYVLNIFNNKISFNSIHTFLIYLSLTSIISFLTYKFFELPLKKLIRKKFLNN